MTFKSPRQPLCHMCGKAIPKHSQYVYVRGPQGESARLLGPLYSKEECQEVTNQQVLSVRYATQRGADSGPHYVSHFTTWDGESYTDEFFCSGPCVDRFAYLMARAGRCTNLYNEAMAKAVRS